VQHVARLTHESRHAESCFLPGRYDATTSRIKDSICGIHVLGRVGGPPGSHPGAEAPSLICDVTPPSIADAFDLGSGSPPSVRHSSGLSERSCVYAPTGCSTFAQLAKVRPSRQNARAPRGFRTRIACFVVPRHRGWTRHGPDSAALPEPGHAHSAPPGCLCRRPQSGTRPTGPNTPQNPRHFGSPRLPAPALPKGQ
jgi:hypothetical protein